MTGARAGSWALVLGTALCLWQGSPGQWWAQLAAPVGGGLATALGLAGLYLLACWSARPAFTGYLAGTLYMLGFSWSLRHISFAAYVAVGVVGGLYYLLLVTGAAWSPRRLRPWVFASGVAATAWLRAHMPEIYYPHGQAAHALYELPELLGPVRWSGELGMNLVLAAAVAWCAELATARPGARRPVAVALAAVVGAWALASLGGSRRGAAAPAPAVEVLLVEPGVPVEFFAGRATFVEVLLGPLLGATRAALEEPGAAPPDLIVWPESSLPLELIGEPPVLPGPLGRSVGYYAPDSRLPRLAAGTRLVAGTTWRHPEPDPRRRGVVALFDHDYRLVGVQEKRWPVPGGERVPFLGLLPRTWAAKLLEWSTGMVRDVPDLASGALRPPLETAAGEPFAGLLCYDNAFPGVAADAVTAGARFLVVSSNEAWYHLGAELDQMVALSVFRTLETGVPMVRSTVDGPTCHVDADGRVRARLEPPRAGEPGRVRRVAVRPSEGTRPWVLTVQGFLGPLVASAFGALWLIGLWRARAEARGAPEHPSGSDQNPSPTRS